MASLPGWVGGLIADWLTRESPPPLVPPCDFERLRHELRPGDVILVEGRSRVAEVISLMTQSPWTHAMLFVGRLFDIEDPEIRALAGARYQGDCQEQLVIEALLGKGTIVTALSDYGDEHLRICRPEGLSHADGQRVIGHAISYLGWDYDIRQILDLARFFFPWTILPRRWRSSLFQHNAGDATRTVCSTLLAESFGQVDFPIRPFIDRDADGSVRFFKRNPRLFTPRDFDYSPYFNIIKYPFLGVSDLGLYRRLPWCHDEALYNDNDDFLPTEPVGRALSNTKDTDGRVTDVPLSRYQEG